MPRYAAFLRGVAPANCKMPDLKAAFEVAGFTDVKTVLSSGNVVFTGPRLSESSLERKAEAAMHKMLGREFLTIIRSFDHLHDLLASDPYRKFKAPAGAKRIVTFLRNTPEAKLALPLEKDGARVLLVNDREVFSDYVRTPKGPVFMTLLEKTFGKENTTRTWDTVAKVAKHS